MVKLFKHKNLYRSTSPNSYNICHYKLISMAGQGFFRLSSLIVYEIAAIRDGCLYGIYAVDSFFLPPGSRQQMHGVNRLEASYKRCDIKFKW